MGNMDREQRQGTKTKNGEQRIRKDKDGGKREKITRFPLLGKIEKVKKVSRTTETVHPVSERGCY